jgi:protein TIF31
MPKMIHYTCSHLEHNGVQLTEIIEIQSLPGALEQEKLVLDLKETPYGERDSRNHILRLRELLFCNTERDKSSHHTLDSSLSVFASVTGERFMNPDFDSDILQQTQQNQKVAETIFDHQELKNVDYGAFLMSTLSKYRKNVKALHSLGVSGWSPAPAWRRLRGTILRT